ncbi:MAG TPA: hypothetical protein VLL08_15740, partial [Kineosporiaceae bacterium]|nr:hypothetical protein [Kineosporiaceae bacterium]
MSVQDVDAPAARVPDPPQLSPRSVMPVWGWLAIVVVTVFGGVLRFWRLDRPHLLVFDETY